jgi:1-acyl-sn-glycerol-3-phosphate acyltransferase
VEGLEHIPQKTNFIIVSNHNSYLDPVLIMAAVPKKIYCIALRFLYNVFLIGWFLKKIEALPVGSASKKAIYLLEHDKNVGLFPEGGVSPDGKMREFRRGAALLAYKTGRPIVPCAVIGAFEAFSLEAKFPKFLPIKIKIGKPIYLLKEFDDIIDDTKLQEGLFEVRRAIKEMFDANK